MKQFSLMRSLKLSLVAFALLVTLGSSAQSPVNTSYPVRPAVDVALYRGSSDSRFILVIKNPAGERVCITIKGSPGKVYQTVTRKKNLRTIFDLSQVDDDQYTLTVVSNSHKFSKDLELRTIYAAATKTVEFK